jgi:thiamine transport system substrate-binding protein
MRINRFIGFAAITTMLATTAAACGSSPGATPTTDANPKSVTLLAYDAFTPEKGIFDDFTAQTGATVNVVTDGDSGAVISKAILTAGKPEGDVLWGIDNTTIARAQQAKLMNNYSAVDEGDVCINYDKLWYQKKGLAVPTSLDDIIKPEYKGQLVIEDPANSSPGLIFMLATIAKYGESGWKQWWSSAKANGVRIDTDWTTAYTIDFSGSSGKGQYPMVVSYGSSPPAEVVYSPWLLPEPTTAVMESSCFRQTEYAGVLRGTKNPNIAQKLVDYLLAKKFQESMPLSLFVYPVNPQAVLPDVFTHFAVKAKTPLTLPEESINKNVKAWLDQWRATAL